MLGGEHWTKEELFDVKGKTDVTAKENYASREAGDKILQARLRTLLAERFDLKVTESTALLPVLALEKGPGTPHFNPPKQEGNFTMGWGTLACNNSTMSDFAELLSNQLQKPVVDRTNLPGSYSFELKWNPEETAASSTLPSVETAVREQLGLRLTSSKGPLKVIHVVRAQKPSAN